MKKQISETMAMNSYMLIGLNNVAAMIGIPVHTILSAEDSKKIEVAMDAMDEPTEETQARNAQILVKSIREVAQRIIAEAEHESAGGTKLQ